MQCFAISNYRSRARRESRATKSGGVIEQSGLLVWIETWNSVRVVVCVVASELLVTDVGFRKNTTSTGIPHQESRGYFFFFLLKKKKILWDEQLRRGTGWFRKLKSMKCVFQMVAKLSVTMLDMKPSTSHLTTGKQRRKAPPPTFQSHVRS